MNLFSLHGGCGSEVHGYKLKAKCKPDMISFFHLTCFFDHPFFLFVVHFEKNTFSPCMKVLQWSLAHLKWPLAGCFQNGR